MEKPPILHPRLMVVSPHGYLRADPDGRGVHHPDTGSEMPFNYFAPDQSDDIGELAGGVYAPELVFISG